jgi:formylglycine-generating enzyme required for sulfatase activity
MSLSQSLSAPSQTSLLYNVSDEACSGTCTGTCSGTCSSGDPANCAGTCDANCTGTCEFWVYSYEASRPDSSDTAQGSSTTRACSTQGVLPWSLVDYDTALNACTAAGLRLCTEAEWQMACGAETNVNDDIIANWEYPYHITNYDGGACNGIDFDTDNDGVTDEDVAMVTGGFEFGESTSQCVSPSGAVDMSGNLKEWTDTEIDTDSFRVKGGSYNNIEEGLTCDLAFAAFDRGQSFDNLGFRCCASLNPNPNP